MPSTYDPSSVEPKWQKKWEEASVFDFDLQKAKDPFYLLVMFPYPSGARLHVGHWFQYSIPDSYGRFLKMKGKDVFHPMGFDAFGLPAENYAIKTGTPPAQSTHENVTNMIEQYKRMGVMFDWKYSLNTSTPEYYRWTQWLFLQMYKNDLAYKKLGNVNWCPKDQTVLANEQVHDGKCERCGTEVVQKPLDQWYWKITNYAEQLIDGLDALNWPEKTKLMQRNWIGKSEGAEIDFGIEGHDAHVTVFTTRPDTLFGATYMVLAPEHPLVPQIVTDDRRKDVERYIAEAGKKTELQRKEMEKEKTGEFTGAYAINPASGEKMPIWIADYVLMNYGTGAIMAVPGHDERDWEFAKKFKLSIVEVVQGGDVQEAAFTSSGTLVNSDFLNDLDVESAKKKMIEWLEKNGKGRGVINYRLRDWLVSRQRYWGAPIPIVYDPEGNAHPIPEEHLPWTLPTDVEFKPTGESPLRNSKEFIERTEKIFGKGWTPEFDTMDTFVCSSFYYLRYLMTGSSGEEKFQIPNSKFQFVDSELEKKWLPVDMYIGGPEHATMHLIYARFVMKALCDWGIVSHDEPFQRLVHQGLITNKGAKMSKSKGNVVSPDDYVSRYGSDVFRMFLMFMGPFTDGGDWSDTGIKGVDRFVQRAWRFVSEKAHEGASDDPKATAALHATIKKVTESIQRLHFNTAIASLMEFLNEAERFDAVSTTTAKTLALLLAPLAPHMAEEMWELLEGDGLAIGQSWPTYDESLLVSDTMTIVVQINGKVRGSVAVPTGASQEEILAAAREEENVRKYLAASDVKKEIYVKGKLVSFVI